MKPPVRCLDYSKTAILFLFAVGWTAACLTHITAEAGQPRCRESSNARFNPSREGYIMIWLGCGPFPNPTRQRPRLLGGIKERTGFDTDWLRPVGGEKRVAPQMGSTVPLEGQPPRAWRPIAAELTGHVNLFHYFQPNSRVVAYAGCTLHCDRAARARMLVGSNDGIKMWLNGDRVYEFRGTRPWAPDENSVPISLKAGPNRLLVKVDQLVGGWGFSVRLVDTVKEPLDGVVVELPGRASPHDIQALLAQAVEADPEPPALTEGDALSLRLRAGPTAPRTDAEIRATGFVVDRLGAKVARLGTVRVGGNRERTAAFEPWPASELRDGAYVVRVELATLDGAPLGTTTKPLSCIQAYGRWLRGAKSAVATAATDLDDSESVLSTITLPSLERLLFDTEKCWAEFEDYLVDRRYIQNNLSAVTAGARALARGRDWFAIQPGHHVKAYRDKRDGSLQPYSVYVPRGYDPSVARPLVIGLHGAVSNHWLHFRRVMGVGYGAAELDHASKKVMPPLPNVPMLVACPNGRETFSYEGMGEDDVWRVAADMKRAYNVDESRIYLTGLSMGGTGTWRLGLLYPDRFAAIAPLCGVTDYRFSPLTPEDLAPYERVILECESALNQAENALHLPIHAFHGSADPGIPAANSQALFKRFNELGYRVASTEYSAMGHPIWDNAYHRASIFSWFAQYRREPHPRRVIYKGIVTKPMGAYWARIDAPRRLRAFSSIEAAVDKNRAWVRVENVRRFSLLLDHHLVDVDRPVAVTINDQSLPRVFVEESRPVGFEWIDGAFQRVFGPHEAPLRPGLGMRALRDWHAYVYGTSGFAHETLANREAAERAADWGDWIDVDWPILRDTEVTPEILESTNLVLIGTPRNNRLLGRIADRLPIAIERDAIRVGRRRYRGPLAGLTMVYRNPLARGRLVFVNAAFTPDGYANLRNNLPFAPPDYIVFNGKGAIARAGFFDAAWQLDK